jgi:gluconokinase
MMNIVVMGVAGCGKSEVGQKIADLLGIVLVEGDHFHPKANVEKMRAGIPLTDSDRQGWLNSLCAQMIALSKQGQFFVLTCSALKRTYRDVLRDAMPGLSFLFLMIDPATALARVAARAGHFYPPHLVVSQFEALEDPRQEPGVISLSTDLSSSQIAQTAVEQWKVKIL